MSHRPIYIDVLWYCFTSVKPGLPLAQKPVHTINRKPSPHANQDGSPYLLLPLTSVSRGVGGKVLRRTGIATGCCKLKRSLPCTTCADGGTVGLTVTTESCPRGNSVGLGLFRARVSVGGDDGRAEGIDVGSPVGVPVGTIVGRSVGERVGLMLGRSDGWPLGSAFGMVVGANVGNKEGEPVGT